jgi:hypothetical protein
MISFFLIIGNLNQKAALIPIADPNSIFRGYFHKSQSLFCPHSFLFNVVLQWNNQDSEMKIDR